MKKVPVYNLQTISCKPSKVGDIEILTFEDHLKNSKDVHFPHRHDFYYILYISNGGGTHTIDFTTYMIKPGQLYFMSPGQVHEWNIKPGTKGFTLFFNERLFFNEGLKIEEEWPYFHSLFNKPVYQLSTGSIKETEKWFGWILTEYGKSGADTVKHLLAAFLYKLNGALKPANKTQPEWKSDILRKYELLVSENFRSEQQVSFYADKLNISANYLNAVCKTNLDKSAKSLINERILLEAKRLLLHSNLNIEEISRYLDFKTSSYFIRFFKKYGGQTPLRFKIVEK